MTNNRKLRVLVIPSDVKQECYVSDVLDDWQSMKKIVDGYIEVVRTKETVKVHTGMVMVVNEEGIIKGLPFNSRATVLYPYGEGIRGDAFLVEESKDREMFTNLHNDITSFPDVLDRLRNP